MPFDTQSYSRFKYGDGNIARLYAFGLAEVLAQTRPELIYGNEQVVITSSAFKYVPTASHAIATAFQDAISYLRYTQGLPASDNIKIHRAHVEEGDYGTRSLGEREEIMRRNGIRIDGDYIKGKHLLIIDDVIITGSHERKVEQIIDSLGLLSVQFLYALQMDAEEAKADPTIEDRLNHSAVRTLENLAQIIETRNFLINARVCKFVLSQKEPAELSLFLQSANNEFLYSLYVSAIGDGYVYMEGYQANTKLIEKEMMARGLIKDGKLQPPSN